MSNHKEKHIDYDSLNIYEQRFYRLIKLIRIDRMLKDAEISPSPYERDNSKSSGDFKSTDDNNPTP